MTSPPGITPTTSSPSERNQDEAAKAASRTQVAARRHAKRIRAEVAELVDQAERMPRKRKLSACDQRVGGPNWRTSS